MTDLIPAIGSTICFGLNGAATKNAIDEAGRHKAIAYGYAIRAAILLAGCVLFRVVPAIPIQLLPVYFLEIAIGAGGVIAFYKAMELGRSGTMLALSQSYALLVLLAGVLFLGENPSPVQIAGSLIILFSAIIIGAARGGRLENGTAYLLITVMAWGVYYTAIKVFVDAMGPLGATVALECGIFVLVSMFYIIRGKDLSLPTESGLKSIGVEEIIATSGSLLYSFSVLAIGAGLTAAIGSGALLVNSVASYFWLKEELDARTYLGIAAMVVGLILIAA